MSLFKRSNATGLVCSVIAVNLLLTFIIPLRVSAAAVDSTMKFSGFSDINNTNPEHFGNDNDISFEVDLRNTGDTNARYVEIRLDNADAKFTNIRLGYSELSNFSNQISSSTVTDQKIIVNYTAGWFNPNNTKTFRIDLHFNKLTNNVHLIPKLSSTVDNTDNSGNDGQSGVYVKTVTPQTSAAITNATPSLTAEPQQGKIKFTWQSVPTAILYKIIKDDNDDTVFFAGTAEDNPTGATVDTVGDGNNHSYKLYAFDEEGNASNPSAAATVKVDAATTTPPNNSTSTSITQRDIHLISLGLSTFIGYQFIKQFRWRGND